MSYSLRKRPKRKISSDLTLLPVPVAAQQNPNMTSTSRLIQTTSSSRDIHFLTQ